MTTSYPLEPLARAMGITLSQPGHPTDHDRCDSGLVALADRLGISLPTAHRRRRNGLPWWEADRYAIAIGRLPGSIWPDFNDDAPGEDTLTDGEGFYTDDPPLDQLDPLTGAIAS